MGTEVSVAVHEPRVDILPAENDCEIMAAHAVVESIGGALHERDKCLIALSGGRTPRAVYRRLGDLLVARPVDLGRVYLIFVDERMVPPDDPTSNYGMGRRELIARVGAPPLHVYRIRGEANPDIAAQEYERELDSILSLFDGRCDMTLLGVGEDGHTASLFPGAEVLRERQRTVRAVFVPHLNSWRVTLTLPLINRSRAVLFLATGEQKAAIVWNVLAGTHSSEDLPATMVRPDVGAIRWILDAKAASRLPPERSSRGKNSEDERDTK
jgi:6-phosphogluconolactonase